MLIECKHTTSLITSHSVPFKEGMVEFLASLPLQSAIGYKKIIPIFITNSSTSRLQKDINKLKIAKDEDLGIYLTELKTTAGKKWKHAILENVTIMHIRSCLNLLKFFTVDDATLNHLKENNLQFRNELEKIQQSTNVLLHELPETVSIDTKCILKYIDDEYIETRWHLSSVAISRSFIEWLKKYVQPDSLIKEINFDNIPSNELLQINCADLSLKEQDMIVTSCINDILKEKKINLAIVYSSINSRIFIFEPSKLYDSVSQYKESDYHFVLNKIYTNLNLPISGTLLITAVSESCRISVGSVLDKSYFISD